MVVFCDRKLSSNVSSDTDVVVIVVAAYDDLNIDALSLGYICPDQRTTFRSAIFSTIFRHRRRSWAKTYVLTIHTGIVRFFDLPFVDVLIQKRKAIVRQSYVSADST